MSAVPTCTTEGCGRTANEPGGARGFCARCYQRDRRAAKGVKVRAEPYAPPGQGDEVTFRIPRAEKERVAALARRFKLESPSALYREIVRAFLEIGADLQAEMMKGKR